MDFSGLLKLKSVDKEFILAISAFKGNCIAAIFKGKQIVDRFSIPTHMRFLMKNYIRKLIESDKDTLRFPIIKTKFNKSDGKFSPDIKVILHKNNKYQYKPYYLEIIHTDINLHMNFPLIIAGGVSVNEERVLPLSSDISIAYILDFFETQLNIAVFLSKSDENISSTSGQPSKGFMSI